MAHNSNGIPTSKALTRIGVLRASGLVLLSLAVSVQSIAMILLIRDNTNIRKESACRFEVNVAVDSFVDNITALTSEIFVAAIREDTAEVARLGDALDAEVRQLRPALADREKAVQDCTA